VTPGGLVVLALVAFVSSALTLFSGFGLGTLLLPAFVLFFPPPLAVAATAVVHLANNLFKLWLVGRYADRGVVLRFGGPAALAAFAGAAVLNAAAGLPPLASWSLGARRLFVTPLDLGMGLLMLVFALLDVLPRFQRLAFERRWLPLGGVLSGFFGGLSGHQGALRAAFLVKSGLGKEAFIGTNVVIAVLVDVVRLAVYGHGSPAQVERRLAVPVTVATLSAFAGAFLGARLVHKITYRTVQLAVAGMLVAVALALSAGLLG
jgi:uncharacterized membrane protein YfcA